MTFGLRSAKMLGLVSNIFNLCGHDPPTSQADRQTDRRTVRQTNRRHAIASALWTKLYSASRGKNEAKPLK